MTLQTPSRRGFITGLGAFFCAAPAIVRAQNIMPVKTVIPFTMDELLAANAQFGPFSNWEELVDVTRTAFVPRLFVQLYYTSPFLAALADLEA